MLVTDRRRLAGRDLVPFVREAARAGVDLVQVREKDLPGRALRALVAEVVEAVAGTGARVLVNGRPDVAEVAGASGVQLPERGLPVAEVKRAFPQLLVGASCHSVQGALHAQAEGADLVVLGPIFATPGKEGRTLGLDAVAELAHALAIPLYAIGGIDARSVGPLARAGVRGVAAIRAFLEGSPEAAVRALREGARA